MLLVICGECNKCQARFFANYLAKGISQNMVFLDEKIFFLLIVAKN